MIYYGILIYIASLVFEGPIRFFLQSYGIEYVLYSRDMFIILCLVVYIIKSLNIFKINRAFLIVIIILIFHSIIGIYILNNYLMILFAWKIYLLLLFGILYGQLFFINLRLTVRFFSILVICAISGVIINYYWAFPWEGLTYSLGGFDIQGVEVYGMPSDWALVVLRRSGFSKNYLIAAMDILLLATFLICYLNNNLFMVLIWFFSGLAISLTLAKGVILVYLLITILLLCYRIIPNYYNIYQKVLLVIALIGIAAPYLTYIISPYHDVPVILLSIIQRTLETWPGVFNLVKSHGNLIVGRGFGGMGPSQLYFEFDKINPGDNVFMSFYGNFGIFGILYLLYAVIIAQSLELKREMFYYLFVISFYCVGITTSTIDIPLFSLFFGVFIGYMQLLNQNYLIRAKHAPVKRRANDQS